MRMFLVFFVLFCGACATLPENKPPVQTDEATLKIQQLESQNKIQSVKIDELYQNIISLEKQVEELKTTKENLDSTLVGLRGLAQDQEDRRRLVEDRVREFQDFKTALKEYIDRGEIKLTFQSGKVTLLIPADTLFQPGHTQMLAEGKPLLKKVTAQLIELKDYYYQVEGHTDGRPPKDKTIKNQWDLSFAQAKAVFNELTEEGLPAQSLSIGSFANTRLVSDEENEEGQKANRRIQLVIEPNLKDLPGYEELRKITRGEELNSTPTSEERSPATEPEVVEGTESENPLPEILDSQSVTPETLESRELTPEVLPEIPEDQGVDERSPAEEVIPVEEPPASQE